MSSVKANKTKWRNTIIGMIVLGVIGSLIASFLYSGLPSWMRGNRSDPSSLVGGCERFNVYAQNRWAPLGTSVRIEPMPTADKVGGYAPNELIAVDGWVRTRSPYPANPPPWNSDVWFHAANNKGWVAFAGVRADPTSPDPTGFDPDGGQPAPVDEKCSGSVR